MATKKLLGNRELSKREYLCFGIAVLFFYVITPWCQDIDASRRAVNPIPPIYFNTDEDINSRNMNLMLDWLSDNFTDLHEISKAIANLKRGDTLHFVGK